MIRLGFVVRSPLSPELSRWLAESVGPIESANPCGWAQSPSSVWRVTLSDCSTLYLKQFKEESKRNQEIEAYERWVPLLRDQPFSLPNLIAKSHPDLCAIALSALDGQVAADEPLTSQEVEELHSQAGVFIRKLHSLPFDDPDPVPLSEALPLRLQFWCSRDRQWLSREEIDLACLLVGNGRQFSGDRRVPCHRDYQMRNWIFNQSPCAPTLGIIDFEHSRADHPLTDFVRVYEDAARDHATWWRAFSQGYGYAMNRPEFVRLRAIAAIHAVGSVVWG